MSEQATRGKGLLENLLTNLRYKRVRKLLPPSAGKTRMLDIGCGKVPTVLKKFSNYKERYGLDLHIPYEVVKQYEKEKIFLKSLELGADTKLPYEEGFFDVVISLAVLEHLPSDVVANLVNEAYRVLKPEGWLLATTPAPFADVFLRIGRKLGLVSRVEIEDHKCYYTTWFLEKLLQDAGFKNIRVGFFQLGVNTYIVGQKQP